MADSPLPTPNAICTEGFARLLGVELESAERDHAVVRLPYKATLGVGRVHGGAISALVDIAATCAFWSIADPPESARGATVGFDIHFLRLSVATDLIADARVRRRGGTLSTGEVVVSAADGQEVAIATVTYKLSGNVNDR